MIDIDAAFWSGRKVFVTGHTGFKGSWLCLWLRALGAEVTGYGRMPPAGPSLFELARIGRTMTSVIGDVRDPEGLAGAMRRAAPEVVLHLAAQPLVRTSYRQPVETYATNVMGTVHLLEAVRACGSVRAVVIVTTDKCYENDERDTGYAEHDRLGGRDPYSSSKACAELVAAAYRSSYFHPAHDTSHGAAVATARSGNVIGGGDWAQDRLVPDCLDALLNGERIRLRSPGAIRPWQHVLEPLGGYLLLAQRLFREGSAFAEAWNFGPAERDMKPVSELVETLCGMWDGAAGYAPDDGDGNRPHEAHVLKLICTKATARLGWRPKWDLDTALGKVVEWARAYRDGEDAAKLCLAQIEQYGRHGTTRRGEGHG